MRVKSSMNELETRATEALRSLLGQVSVIKLKGIQRESAGSVLAQIDVLGHNHTLACDVQSSARPEALRTALRARQRCARQGETAIQVVIAPYLSPEAQQICKENQAGFLDLEGNARLALGEFFIGKRALSHKAPVAAVRSARASGSVRVQPPAA